MRNPPHPSLCLYFLDHEPLMVASTHRCCTCVQLMFCIYLSYCTFMRCAWCPFKMTPARRAQPVDTQCTNDNAIVCSLDQGRDLDGCKKGRQCVFGDRTAHAHYNWCVRCCRLRSFNSKVHAWVVRRGEAVKAGLGLDDDGGDDENPRSGKDSAVRLATPVQRLSYKQCECCAARCIRTVHCTGPPHRAASQ